MPSLRHSNRGGPAAIQCSNLEATHGSAGVTMTQGLIVEIMIDAYQCVNFQSGETDFPPSS